MKICSTLELKILYNTYHFDNDSSWKTSTMNYHLGLSGLSVTWSGGVQPRPWRFRSLLRDQGHPEVGWGVGWEAAPVTLPQGFP